MSCVTRRLRSNSEGCIDDKRQGAETSVPPVKRGLLNRYVFAVIVFVACSRGEPEPQPPSTPAPARATSSLEESPSTPAPARATSSSEAVAPQREAGCEAAGVTAARTALEVAAERGVDGDMLDDCRPEKVACDSERGAIERGESCQIAAFRNDARWNVVVLPRPATGAPLELEVWVDEDGYEPGNVRITGSTWGVLEGVQINGRGKRTSHTHGGDPAWIGEASFVVDNRRDEPLDLFLVATRWLVDASCEVPYRERAQPRPAGIENEQGLIDGTMTITIAAQTVQTIRIGHEVQPAYMASCDRFATAAVFELDGEAVEVIAEHRVTRRQPLR